MADTSKEVLKEISTGGLTAFQKVCPCAVCEAARNRIAELNTDLCIATERAEKAEACYREARDLLASTRDELYTSRARVAALEGAARVVCREFYQQHPLIKALSAALSAPPAPATCNDSLQVGAVKASLTTADKQKVAAALKWSAENKPGHGLHDVPGVGMVHFNDGSGPSPETLARWERDEDLSQAAADVLAERHRQVEVEGWTPEHDDEHANGEMGRAAACYAAYHELDAIEGMSILPALWPKEWSLEWWKPRDARRNLVRSGALILAEIERLDRAAQAEREG